ncbi:hypothetical protein D9757_010610 [Collybiopsis confluens]|uniref:HNH nuclease domain-containing protein n=1 Tax=Collybiopsis confluens TaxID=2823264 RepID=A0A8H5GRZ4_9AGAR|nr:hypothetical protein D9757_010610 [Collybiopsis confluens]
MTLVRQATSSASSELTPLEIAPRSPKAGSLSPLTPTSDSDSSVFNQSLYIPPDEPPRTQAPEYWNSNTEDVDNFNRGPLDPLTRRSARISSSSRPSLVESPVTDDETSTHGRDLDFVPSGPSPIKPIHRGRSAPKTKQPQPAEHVRYISPDRNIIEKQSLAQSDKDEVAKLAPHGRRCIITHLEGLEVEFCHLLRRTTDPEQIRRLEWYFGLPPGTLFVNTRWNIVCLVKEIHTYFDRAGFILIPKDNAVMSSLHTFSEHNFDASVRGQRYRYDELDELSKYIPVVAQETTTPSGSITPPNPPQVSQAVPPSNSPVPTPPPKAATYKYRITVLNNIPKNRRWSRLILKGSKESGFQETTTYKDYHYPFTDPDLQDIESHVHPVFALAHARQNLDLLSEEERLKLFIDEPAIQTILQLTEGWFHSENSASVRIPLDMSDFLAERIRDPALPQDVVTTTPERLKARSKGKSKGKSKAESRGTGELSTSSLPQMSHSSWKDHYWKVSAPTDEIARRALQEFNEQLRAKNSRVIVEPFDPNKPLGYVSTRSRARTSHSESQHSQLGSVTFSQPPVSPFVLSTSGAGSSHTAGVSASTSRSGGIQILRKRARTMENPEEEND